MKKKREKEQRRFSQFDLQRNPAQALATLHITEFI